MRERQREREREDRVRTRARLEGEKKKREKFNERDLSISQQNRVKIEYSSIVMNPTICIQKWSHRLLVIMKC